MATSHIGHAISNFLWSNLGLFSQSLLVEKSPVALLLWVVHVVCANGFLLLLILEIKLIQVAGVASKCVGCNPQPFPSLGLPHCMIYAPICA